MFSQIQVLFMQDLTKLLAGLLSKLRATLEERKGKQSAECGPACDLRVIGCCLLAVLIKFVAAGKQRETSEPIMNSELQAKYPRLSQSS